MTDGIEGELQLSSKELEMSSGMVKVFGKSVGRYGVILREINENVPDSYPDEIPKDKEYISFLEIGNYYEESIITDSGRDYIKEKFLLVSRQLIWNQKNHRRESLKNDE